MGKEWPCEHIFKTEMFRSGWMLKDELSSIQVPKSWNECPICLKPRPSEPKKSLACKLADNWINQKADWHEQAKTAISHVLGVVESQTIIKTSDCSSWLISKEELIKKLKEEGEG